MRGQLVLIDGQREPELTEVLVGLGFSSAVERREGVAGDEVWRAVEDMQGAHPERPLTMFAWLLSERWTLLSDLMGAVFEEVEALRALSRKLEGRVLVLSFDPDEASITWLASGAIRRRLRQTADGLEASGDPLPIEAMFVSPNRLEPDDVLTLLQSLGIDLMALNTKGRYVVAAY
jgi:hypothetical protein